MKLIKAYIRHHMAEDEYNALKKEGFCCMTILECEGTGRYSDHKKKHIGNKYPFADSYRVISFLCLSPSRSAFVSRKQKKAC